MNREIVLTNDKQRKEFLQNYFDESLGWQHIWFDPEMRFNYYRAYFLDGSFITVLDSRDGNVMPIKTLTKSGQKYFPTWSTQTDMVKHLKNVANKD
ncbi:MAG: hypothetical protein ACLTXM_02620 [Enterococcus sp.]